MPVHIHILDYLTMIVILWELFAYSYLLLDLWEFESVFWAISSIIHWTNHSSFWLSVCFHQRIEIFNFESHARWTDYFFSRVTIHVSYWSILPVAGISIPVFRSQVRINNIYIHDIHREIKRGENFKQTFENSAKIDETIAKSKTTYLHSGVEQVWAFSKILTGGDDRGWKWFHVREHLFTKANANPKPGKTDHSVAFQNSYWRIKAQNTEAHGYLLTVLCSCG
jgi:hypothetical protein